MVMRNFIFQIMRSQSVAAALAQNDLAAFQRVVLAIGCDKYMLVDQVAFVLGPHYSEPYIAWLFETFALDAMARDNQGQLRLGKVPLGAIPLLCHRYHFKLRDCDYTQRHMEKRHALPWEYAMMLVYWGTPRTPHVHPLYAPLFDARTACAKACRALLCALRRPPWRAWTAPQIARIMAALIWKTRVQTKVWKLY
jgi:hypothetical protein